MAFQFIDYKRMNHSHCIEMIQFIPENCTTTYGYRVTPGSASTGGVVEVQDTVNGLGAPPGDGWTPILFDDGPF